MPPWYICEPTGPVHSCGVARPSSMARGMCDLVGLACGDKTKKLPKVSTLGFRTPGTCVALSVKLSFTSMKKRHLRRWAMCFSFVYPWFKIWTTASLSHLPSTTQPNHLHCCSQNDRQHFAIDTVSNDGYCCQLTCNHWFPHTAAHPPLIKHWHPIPWVEQWMPPFQIRTKGRRHSDVVMMPFGHCE